MQAVNYTMRPLGVFGILGEALRIYARNFVLIVGISAVVLIPYQVIWSIPVSARALSTGLLFRALWCSQFSGYFLGVRFQYRAAFAGLWTLRYSSRLWEPWRCHI